MDSGAQIRWLHRRAGLGLAPTAYDTALARGPQAELAGLLDPSTVGLTPDRDPWDGLALDPRNGGRKEAVLGWLKYLLSADRTFEARRTWMLHGWLVSAIDKVVSPTLMVEQIRMLARLGGGSFAELLRAVTTDGAMLVYLDGGTSTGDSPNENYGRELMELFSLGVGTYTEADVRAAALALTGWVARKARGVSEFEPSRHDSTAQTLLGRTDVDDVDTVISAVVEHAAHPVFVATRLTREYLGDPVTPALDGVVDELAAVYTASERSLDATIGAALSLGLDGATSTLVLAPVPWLAMALRSTGVEPDVVLKAGLGVVRQMGQVPMLPPNVAGWPNGAAWYSSSTLVARANTAALIAKRTADDAPVLVAASDGNVDRVAELLGLPEPFGPSTTAALRSAASPRDLVALALASPEGITS
jgi:uncharacterized protein (DUF1800 family)